MFSLSSLNHDLVLVVFSTLSYAWDSGRTSSRSSSRVSISRGVSALGDFRTRGLVLGTGLGFGELGGVLIVVMEKRTYTIDYKI